jgi:hypothetical protein
VLDSVGGWVGTAPIVLLHCTFLVSLFESQNLAIVSRLRFEVSGLDADADSKHTSRRFGLRAVSDDACCCSLTPSLDREARMSLLSVVVYSRSTT